MKFVRLPAPGTILSGEALIYLIKKYQGRSLGVFADIGCGSGHYSKLLMDRLSCRGELFEPGETPFQICSADLDQYVQSGRCSIHNRPLASEDENRFSTLICWHVIEHIEDDLEFAKMLHGATADNGYLYIAVPARDDYWGIEDETTGHFRRYTRATLTDLLHRCGYEVPEVISSNVPTSNLLLGLSNAVIRNQESNKLSMNKEHQTVTSGVREIRWKTVYPSIFHLILNRFTLWPLHLLQKLFFNSDYGTMIIAVATKRRPGSDSAFQSG